MATEKIQNFSEWFWTTVGDDVYNGLNQNQRTAIEEAAQTRLTDTVRSDIRLSFGKYFLVILFGEERRSKLRLKQEREKRPVFISRNLPVILIMWGSLLFALYSLLGYGLKAVLGLLG